jgi:hypothetical protein
MVEISLSGSGGGPGKVTTRGYPTLRPRRRHTSTFTSTTCAPVTQVSMRLGQAQLRVNAYLRGTRPRSRRAR